MHHRSLFIAQTIVIVFVAAIHLSALQWYLYWQYPWLDLLTHFLGGTWLVLSSSWLMAYMGQKISLVRVIAVTLFIGVSWEIFEYFGGIPREANFIFDTSLDLAMDFCGGLFGYLLARRMIQLPLNGKTAETNPS